MDIEKQVLYLGRWVLRDHFCAFVYNSEGEKLTKSYDEFSDAISSGHWFAEKKDVPKESLKVVKIKSGKGKKWQNQQQQ